MKKSHRNTIPDFSRPSKLDPRAVAGKKTAPPPAAPRAKPQMTNVKSGRRGQ
jgi:hypothetical protein